MSNKHYTTYIHVTGINVVIMTNVISRSEDNASILNRTDNTLMYMYIVCTETTTTCTCTLFINVPLYSIINNEPQVMIVYCTSYGRMSLYRFFLMLPGKDPAVRTGFLYNKQITITVHREHNTDKLTTLVLGISSYSMYTPPDERISSSD